MQKYRITVVPVNPDAIRQLTFEIMASDRTIAQNLALIKATKMRPGVRYRLHDDERGRSA